jgi:hypothetical protein
MKNDRAAFETIVIGLADADLVEPITPETSMTSSTGAGR